MWRNARIKWNYVRMVLLIWVIKLIEMKKQRAWLLWGGAGFSYKQILHSSIYSTGYTSMSAVLRPFSVSLYLHLQGEIFSKGTFLLCIMSMLFLLCPYSDLFMVTRKWGIQSSLVRDNMCKHLDFFLHVHRWKGTKRNEISEQPNTWSNTRIPMQCFVFCRVNALCYYQSGLCFGGLPASGGRTPIFLER